MAIQKKSAPARKPVSKSNGRPAPAQAKTNGGGGQEYDDTNRIVIFPNKNKTAGDQRPDYTGRVNMDGDERWISLWVRTSAQGKKFLSGQVNDPVEPQDNAGDRSFKQSEDDLPF